MGGILGLGLSAYQESVVTVSFLEGNVSREREGAIRLGFDQHRSFSAPKGYWKVRYPSHLSYQRTEATSFIFQKIAPTFVAISGGVILGGVVGGIIAFKRGMMIYLIDGLMIGGVIGLLARMMKPEIFE